jgi:transcriptional regulator with XRE-family HTH domain
MGDSTPDDELLRRLASTSDEAIVERVRKYVNQPMPGNLPSVGMKSPIRLRAYLASALTGLSEDQRKMVFAIQDLVHEVCKEHNVELYQPRLASDPLKHTTLSAPDVFNLDKQQVLRSDLLICMTHEPSFGAGIELEFARNALLPTILLHPAGQTVSRMVLGIPNLLVKVGYQDLNDLRERLADEIGLLVPVLIERRVAFGHSNDAIIGPRIRQLRESNHLSRDDLRAALNVPLEEVVRLEEAPDNQSNPSLLMLRQIATILKVPVSEILEVDPPSSVAQELLRYLQNSALPPVEARKMIEIPEADKRRIWALILERARERLI